MERRKPCLRPFKEVEGTADPNTNASLNMAGFDQLLNKSVLERLGRLPNFLGDVREVNVDNLISFTPNINVSVLPKPRGSNHSLPRAKEDARERKHRVLLDALTESIKSLKNKIMKNSPPLPPGQGTFKDILMRNLCTTDWLIADQRRLIERYNHFCNAAGEHPPTASPLGKSRRAEEGNNPLGSPKISRIVSNLMGRDNSTTEDPTNTVPELKCGGDVECTPATSPQTFPNRLSDNPNELLDIDLSWFTEQSGTKSANRSQVSDVNRILGEFEKRYDSSISDREEGDSTGSLSSEPWDMYSSGESDTSPVDINLQITDSETDHPAFLQQTDMRTTKSLHCTEERGSKGSSSLNCDESPPESNSGSDDPSNFLKERSAGNSGSDSNIPKSKKILQDLKRSHARENSGVSISPPNKTKPSNVFEIARIFAIFLKFYGLISETKDANDVARDICKVLASEKCEDNNMPSKPVKGTANIAIHIEGLCNLMHLLGNGSNFTQISDVKSGSNEKHFVAVKPQVQASHFGNILPVSSNKINSADDSEELARKNEKTAATVNHQEPDMKCVGVANHFNDVRFSQLNDVDSAGLASRINGKFVYHPNLQASKSKKKYVISATSRLLKGNSSTNLDIQKSEAERGNDLSSVRNICELLHFPGNVTDSAKANENAEINNNSASKRNSGKIEKKADTMESQEPKVTGHASEYRVAHGGVSKSISTVDDFSFINFESESSSSSTDTFDFADANNNDGNRLNPTSVSDTPGTSGNLNSSGKMYDATTENLKENGSHYFISKYISEQSENNTANLHKQETTSICNQGHEFECYTANSMVNNFIDLVSPLNYEGAGGYNITSNHREPVTGTADPTVVSCAPEDDNCLPHGGTTYEYFPVTSDSNGFTDYMSPVGHRKAEYYTPTTDKVEPATVGGVNTANFNGCPWTNNLANFGKAPVTAYNSQEHELGKVNVTYPGPLHLPANCIAPTHGSEYDRCLSYGFPWQDCYMRYGNENSHAINTIYHKPELKTSVATNYNNSMIPPGVIHRKYASYDSGNDRHLSFAVYNNGGFRANSDPTHFGETDFPRHHIENEDFTGIICRQENVGNSSSTSLCQIYGTNSTVNKISAQECGNEVIHANQASEFNGTSFSPGSASSKKQCVSGEVNFENSTEPIKQNRSFRAATSFSAPFNYGNNP